MRSTSKRNDLMHRYRQRGSRIRCQSGKEMKTMLSFLERRENENEAQRKLSPSINICWLRSHAVCLLLLRLMMIFKIIRCCATSSRFFFSLSHPLSLSLSLPSFYRVTIVMVRYCTNVETISSDVYSEN